MKPKVLIRKYQAALQAEASEQTKLWWERYMKGVIPFRGVGIPRNRALLFAWRKEHGLDNWAPEKQLDLALAFFNEPFAEDKLAGVLFLQNFLYDKLPWKVLLGKYEEIYANRCIFDWNICDWFCVRVLGPTIKYNGRECARSIVAWKDAEFLWQARSSVVAFINLSSDAQYYPYIQEACGALIKRKERFAKTSVGWILRDISKHDEHFVESFIEKNLAFFSKESLNNALKYFDDEKKGRYLQNLKKKNKVSGAQKAP